MKRIQWTDPAKKDVRALDRNTAMQVFAAIDRHARSGSGDIRKLQAPETGLRLRAGDWRVFFYEPEPNTIRITGVYHRSNAYRR